MHVCMCACMYALLIATYTYIPTYVPEVILCTMVRILSLATLSISSGGQELSLFSYAEMTVSGIL